MLKGKLKSLEAFLLDRIFLRSQAEVQVEYNTKKSELVKVLQEDLEREKKLEEPASLNSFGDYLRLFLEHNGMTLSNAASDYGIDKQTLVSIIDNRVLLTVLEPVVLARLSMDVHLHLEPAIILIEKSLKLYALDPSSKGAMARYSSKEGMDTKDSSMKSGVAELMMKAAERKPFNLQQQIVSNGELKKFLDEFRQAFSSL